MTVKHRLADERSTIAVPFGKCSNPQNVAAEGRGCPIRHQCFGCASFSSDPSYPPEMRPARPQGVRGSTHSTGPLEWAKRDARPSDEEIEALLGHIHTEEDKLAHATSEQRALIDNASATLRYRMTSRSCAEPTALSSANTALPANDPRSPTIGWQEQIRLVDGSAGRERRRLQ
jgi:hypothetical protein